MSNQITLYSIDGATSSFIDKEGSILYKIIPEPVKNFTDIVIGDNVISNDKYNKYNIKITVDGSMEVINISNENIEPIRIKKIMLETPEIYSKFIPTIESSDKVWIQNIIDKKEETNRILFENELFMILPDFKWNGTIDDLYLLLIVKDQKFMSIRDLRGNNIPMLTGMITSISQLLEEKYKLTLSDVRMYFHYRPSVWQLHLHINNINSTKKFSCSVERAHSIINVINNLRNNPYYYRDAVLEVVL